MIFAIAGRACQEGPAVSLMAPQLRAGPGASLNLSPFTATAKRALPSLKVPSSHCSAHSAS